MKPVAPVSASMARITRRSKSGASSVASRLDGKPAWRDGSVSRHCPGHTPDARDRRIIGVGICSRDEWPRHEPSGERCKTVDHTGTSLRRTNVHPHPDGHRLEAAEQDRRQPQGQPRQGQNRCQHHHVQANERYNALVHVHQGDLGRADAT